MVSIFGSGIVGIIALICAIWVIYDVWAVRKRASVLSKVIWTVLAIIFSIITAIIYWLMYKR